MKTNTPKFLFRNSGLNKKSVLLFLFCFFVSVPLIAQENNNPSITTDTTSITDTLPPAKDSLSQDDFKEISDDLDLSAEELKAFNERARQKVSEFTNYVKIIADIDNSPPKRDMALESALKLFIDPDVNVMQTSYLYKGKWYVRNRTVRKYLWRLRSIGRMKVVIDMYDLIYISDFKKGDDDKYYATATFYQIYTKYSGDRILYSDKTTKTIDIVLERIKDEFYGEKRWVIRLGDVKVTESRLNY